MTDWDAANHVQATCRVGTGVLSGLKGPVIDISICQAAPENIQALGYVRRAMWGLAGSPKKGKGYVPEELLVRV